MALKLNQVIALNKGAKAAGASALNTMYHLVQKHPLMAGVIRTYEPRDDDGERLPLEGNRLQLKVEDILDGAIGPIAREFDLIATLDAGNQAASADVIVDGVTVLAKVPVATLLMLEKRLTDFATFVSKLPVLDPSFEWTWDEGGEVWKTVPSVKTRSKKVPFNHVKAAATDKHPAQVEVLSEDKVVGDWTTINFSGAITELRRRELSDKVAKLAAAIKVAREEANMTEVQDKKIGDAVFDYLGW